VLKIKSCVENKKLCCKQKVVMKIKSWFLAGMGHHTIQCCFQIYKHFRHEYWENLWDSTQYINWCYYTFYAIYKLILSADIYYFRPYIHYTSTVQGATLLQPTPQSRWPHALGKKSEAEKLHQINSINNY
jgi:hypothetical protein